MGGLDVDRFDFWNFNFGSNLFGFQSLFVEGLGLGLILVVALDGSIVDGHRRGKGRER